MAAARTSRVSAHDHVLHLAFLVIIAASLNCSRTVGSVCVHTDALWLNIILQ
jgi:hypothetical protein